MVLVVDVVVVVTNAAVVFNFLTFVVLCVVTFCSEHIEMSSFGATSTRVLHLW